MQDKNQPSNTQPDKEKELADKSKSASPIINDYSEPLLFVGSDNVLFSAAMEDSLFSSDIELGEKILNSSEMAPKVETPRSSETITPPATQEHIAENINTEKNTEQSSPDLASNIHEEILEFDLSDPITEPTTVNEGQEDSFDDIITYYDDAEKNKNIDSDAATDNSGYKKDAVPSEQIIENDIFVVEKSAAVDSNTSEPNVEKVIELQPAANIEETKPLTHNEEIEKKPLESNAILTPGFIDRYQELNNESEEEFVLDEDEFNIEVSSNLAAATGYNIITEIIKEGKHLDIQVDTSREHTILINNSQDFLKYQHTIMDNKFISFFWPTDGVNLVNSRVSISIDKDKTFVLDLDKIDINLLGILLESIRPIKIFFDIKPILIWCLKNNLRVNNIFDITTAMNILSDGSNADNSLNCLLKRFANHEINPSDINFQDIVLISKFILLFRKKLVENFEQLNLMKLLNFEQKLIFALAQSEFDGMPFNPSYSNPVPQKIWELVESKYGVTSEKELAKSGVSFLSKPYLNEKQNLLEVSEYISLKSAERTIRNFDQKYVSGDRILSTYINGKAGNIIANDYSFDGEGLYPFISPSKNNCLVEGKFKDIEVRVVAKLLNNPKLTKSFYTPEGPFAYFASGLFNKNVSEITIDEKFTAKMMFDIVIRSLGERETLFYAWNTAKCFLKEDEILCLKENFIKAHSDLVTLIKETQKKAQNDGYVSSSTGRISASSNHAKAFFTVVELYASEIFRKSLALSYTDFETYNAEFSDKIRLCTMYNNIITLECNKKIVNIAIDMLTRNMTKTASNTLKGIPVLLNVYATEQWEA